MYVASIGTFLRSARGEALPTIATGQNTAATDGLFARQASGLVREIGIPGFRPPTGISLASVAVVNTFINFTAGLTDFAKADMYLPLLVAAAIWFVATFAYRCLLQAVPRAAGEYVHQLPLPALQLRAWTRDAIKRHQPVVGLHGHIHESRGTQQIGSTLCITAAAITRPMCSAAR